MMIKEIEMLCCQCFSRLYGVFVASSLWFFFIRASQTELQRSLELEVAYVR